jgi:hypothetical protein
MSGYKFTSKDGKEVRILKDVKKLNMEDNKVTYERGNSLYVWYFDHDFKIEETK